MEEHTAITEERRKIRRVGGPGTREVKLKGGPLPLNFARLCSFLFRFPPSFPRDYTPSVVSTASDSPYSIPMRDSGFIMRVSMEDGGFIMGDSMGGGGFIMGGLMGDKQIVSLFGASHWPGPLVYWPGPIWLT